MKTKAQLRWTLYGKLGQLTMARSIINNIGSAYPYAEKTTLRALRCIDIIASYVKADIAKLKAKP